MSHFAFKLVDQDGYSMRGKPGETLWLPIGTTVTPVGKGTRPCGPGVLHGYISPEVAVLGNPIHANVVDPVVLGVKSDSPWESDGIKRWTTGECRVLAKVDYPELSIEEIVAWSIVIAPHELTMEWAVRWLDGTDRSRVTAGVVLNKTPDFRGNALSAARRAVLAASLYSDRAAAANAAGAAYYMGMVIGPGEDASPRDRELLLMPALRRARAILVGAFPADKYDDPL